MKRALIIGLCTLLLVSCATPATHYSNNAEYMAAHGIVPTDAPPPLPMEPTTPIPTPPQSTGPSAGEIAATILLFPIWFPIVLLAAAPPYRSYAGVHCRSYTYKDAYHTKCY